MLHFLWDLHLCFVKLNFGLWIDFGYLIYCYCGHRHRDVPSLKLDLKMRHAGKYPAALRFQVGQRKPQAMGVVGLCYQIWRGVQNEGSKVHTGVRRAGKDPKLSSVVGSVEAG
jgi:hypothetical protein